ncbi:23S rRNA (pseudouridine(1915)-N(3))-methyltransferase [Candidatus Syntrophocurvum alkaliphilum]|uniref:Ribosomal RNA large subunit methyltransferase H n=1 Tax=Candidatus Syntrophocurvum alkaliphilum TaxID=2293317 RepID=A0A6I6DF05_9FIRM|nr:23S rRNA (pseudouridine(1915)-N(3))-methyltransferase RlmH [Candidatus Syntrophocurvum alkaliphilum]QGU00656.1 23S rRNA (pseudouridine(1915)-N(3))-methyltransferase [Candidatus Syntrophocurvum alkaliphilum]
MRYKIISIGKVREKFYSQGVQEYIKRLRPYINIEVIDGLEEKISPNAKEKEIQKALEKEASKISNIIGSNELLVVLDINGKQLSSQEFAAQIESWNLSGKKQVNFVIGGANGVADMVRKKADYKLSFSKMTLPHQMAVLVLSEQIYRGCKINRGEPYHK